LRSPSTPIRRRSRSALTEADHGTRLETAQSYTLRKIASSWLKFRLLQDGKARPARLGMPIKINLTKD